MSSKLSIFQKNKYLVGKRLAAVCCTMLFAALLAFACGCSQAATVQGTAKVNGQIMSEERIADQIQTYRANYGLTSNSDWADFLTNYGMTASDFRDSTIDQLATQDLVRARANELGITVTDEEVEAYLNEMKGDKDTGEGSMWEQVLKSAGLTEDMLRDRYRYNLTQRKVLAAEVPERAATDDELVEYAQTYLAGTTQMHIMHIIISGDDAQTRANDLYTQLSAESAAGTLDATKFIEYAKQYSSEADVATTGGVVGWTGSGAISDEVKEIISEDEEGDIVKGSVLRPVKRDDLNGAYEIAYVDETYTLPEASQITNIDTMGAPQGVVDALKAAAVYVAYQNDCTTYLADLLNSATIEYGEMPKDAAYNTEK